ncbi:hypothetical protein [Succinimonas sp.]|uniref:hypothetical protein n=1 Tax=Succinimonas sp. TaxID=1936151 RepID=UPI00386FC207
MELSIRSQDEFHDYLERECQAAAEKGREEGRKEGIKEGEEKTVVYFYKKGLIPRDVAIAKLGVTDQNFETLLQRYS